MKFILALTFFVSLSSQSFARTTSDTSMSDQPMSAVIMEISRVSNSAVHGAGKTVMFVRFVKLGDRSGRQHPYQQVVVAFSGEDLLTASSLKTNDRVVLRQLAPESFQVTSGRADSGS